MNDCYDNEEGKYDKGGGYQGGKDDHQSQWFNYGNFSHHQYNYPHSRAFLRCQFFQMINNHNFGDYPKLFQGIHARMLKYENNNNLNAKYAQQVPFIINSRACLAKINSLDNLIHSTLILRG